MAIMFNVYVEINNKTEEKKNESSHILHHDLYSNRDYKYNQDDMDKTLTHKTTDKDNMKITYNITEWFHLYFF